MKYEERVVAFIDILGFKSLIDNTLDKNGNDNKEAIEKIKKAYDLIAEFSDLDKNSKRINWKTFSDSIVISFGVNDGLSLSVIFSDLMHIIRGFLSLNIMCRGAITFGKLVHSEKYLFGPAFIEAYLLESKAANYPRIILDSSILDIGSEDPRWDRSVDEQREYLMSFVELDSDGMYFLDYFAVNETDFKKSRYDIPEYINNLGEIIRKGLISSSHHSKADIRVKYSWMRERYNRMVENLQKESKSIKIETDAESDLSIFYKSLKKISPNKYNKAFQRTSR